MLNVEDGQDPGKRRLIMLRRPAQTDVDWPEERNDRLREWARTIFPDITVPVPKSLVRRSMKEQLEEKIRRLQELELEIAQDQAILSPTRWIHAAESGRRASETHCATGLPFVERGRFQSSFLLDQGLL
jgi:hypothetical protein